MRLVSPGFVFLQNTVDIQGFLDHQQIEWEIPKDAPFDQVLAEFAGRLCYESWENTDNLNITKTRKGNAEYIENIKKQGHGSVFEHGNLVFLFYNVSRIFTHELVRHRPGSAFSQTSGRYVRLRDLKFWIPDVIYNNLAARSVFLEAIKQAEDNQKRLEEIFGMDPEVSNYDPNLNFDKKKELTSAFRRISFNGAANNILWSTNHRALRHVIQMRCSPHAEEEIRVIFRRVANLMVSKFPAIYGDLREDYTFEYPKI